MNLTKNSKFVGRCSMVASIKNEPFEKSKVLFKSGDLTNSLDYYEKAIGLIDKSKNSIDYIQFLKSILNYCRENQLVEQEARVLRSLGRTHSLFSQHFESLNYHREALKIQRKLGKKLDIAEELVFFAEDLEASEDYNESIKNYQNAAEIFREIGKLKKEKDLQKEISRLKEFSKEVVEDEYIRSKFHVKNLERRKI